MSTPTQLSTNALSEAHRTKAQLDALRPLDHEQEQKVWQQFRLDWNFHSNSLEGNSLTYGETTSLLLHGITAQGKPLKDHLEISGHNQAINEVRDIVKSGHVLTETFVRQLHQLILRERYRAKAQTPDGMPTEKWIEVGQYKTQPNHVLTETGEVFRFAEPSDVPARMAQLVAGINGAHGDPSTDGIGLAALTHYEFVRIHPFDDGNGRMARLLMNLVLMRYGFLPAIIRSEDKPGYLAALRVADGGDKTAFVEFIAERVQHSQQVMLNALRGDSAHDPDAFAKQLAVLQGLKLEKDAAKLRQATDLEHISRSVYNQLLIPIAEQVFNTIGTISSTTQFLGTALCNYSVNNGALAYSAGLNSRAAGQELLQLLVKSSRNQPCHSVQLSILINLRDIAAQPTLQWYLYLSIAPPELRLSCAVRGDGVSHRKHGSPSEALLGNGSASSFGNTLQIATLNYKDLVAIAAEDFRISIVSSIQHHFGIRLPE
jgi:Fic family protein